MAPINEINAREALDKQLRAVKVLRDNHIDLSPALLQRLKGKIPPHYYNTYKAEIDQAFKDVYDGNKTPQQALQELTSGGTTTGSSTKGPLQHLNPHLRQLVLKKLSALESLHARGIEFNENQLKALLKDLKNAIPNYQNYDELILQVAKAVNKGLMKVSQAKLALFGHKVESKPPSLLRKEKSSRHLYGDIWLKAGIGFPFHTKLASSWAKSIYDGMGYKKSSGKFDSSSTFPDALAFPITVSGNLYGDDRRTWQLFWLIDAMPFYFPKPEITFTNINAGFGAAGPVELGAGWALPFRFSVMGGPTIPSGKTEAGIGGNFAGEVGILEKVWGEETIGSLELFIRGGVAAQEGKEYYEVYHAGQERTPKWQSKYSLTYMFAGLRLGFGDRIDPVIVETKEEEPPPTVPLPVIPKENKFLHLKDKLKPTYVQTAGDKKAYGNRDKTVLSQAKIAKIRSVSPTIFPHPWAKDFGYIKFELDVIDVDHVAQRYDIVRPTWVHIVPDDLKLPSDRTLDASLVRQLMAQWARNKGISDPEKYFFSYSPRQRDSTVTAKLSPNTSYKVVAEAGDNGNIARNANRYDNFLVRTNVAHGGLTPSPTPEEVPKKDRFKNTLENVILEDWDRITPSTTINLMFVVDGSGSMDRWADEVRRAVARIISDLRDRGIRGRINVALRTFGENNPKPRTLLTLTNTDGNGLDKLDKALDEIRFDGNDELAGKAVDTSIKLFRRRHKHLNYIFVLSDKEGIDEYYEEGHIPLKDAMAKAKNKNIKVSVFIDVDTRVIIPPFDQIIRGIPCAKDSHVMIYKNGKLKSAILSRDHTIPGQNIPCAKETEVEFYEDGKLSSATLSRDHIIQGIPCAGETTVEFYEDGKLASATLSRDHTIQGIPCAGEITVHFFENGKLEAAMLSRDHTIQGIDLPKFSTVEFYKDGKLRSVLLGRDHTIKGTLFLEDTTIYFDRNGNVLSRRPYGGNVAPL